MTSPAALRSSLRRAALGSAVRVAGRPELVRGSSLAAVAQRDLARRARGRGADHAALLRPYLTSRNDTAAVVALRVARELGGAPLVPAEVVARAVRAGSSLRLAAAGYLRGCAPDLVGAVLADGGVTDAATLAGALDDGAGLGAVARTRADDPVALGVLAGWATRRDGAAGLEALAGTIGDLGAGETSVDPEARLGLATALVGAGALGAASTLADGVVRDRPGSAAARGVRDLTRSALGTLGDGWQPPPRRDGAVAPRTGTVPYLLQQSLPVSSAGYATRTHGLLTALRSAGWDVEGVTRPGFGTPAGAGVKGPTSALDVVDGVPYHRLRPGGAALPQYPVDESVARHAELVDEAFRGRAVPLVHAASNHRNGAAAVSVARGRGVPSVYEVRGLWEYTRVAHEPGYEDTEHFRLVARLEADVARAADRVVTITGALGDVLVERGVDAAAIRVVPNGVDTARFVPCPRDDGLAASLGLDGRTVVGYVGSVVDYEGLELLVEAAALLRDRGRTDLAVLVVGDGDALPALRARADALGVADVVRCVGRVPHDAVERYYSLVDVAPFPRRSTTVTELVSPLKPFEAMASGKLVVASDVAALAEIVRDGETGRTFRKGSAEDLARVLDEVLDDPDGSQRTATQGLDWVRAERDWRTVAAGLAAVWEELGVRP
ncbi:glycosyltransferase [Luteimicrobium subarcticum]|uniref:D-inositol 3-phosphate glycosyltransferase n=1 Tax=Luteimicrobium subarcticum TaxID=620910 RepID=A0A2M8WTR2_9MICO|nr:glycosyltransferase [Luteimicrobium subarcticum]PJI94256.1 glycosyltransferase involved in cell wall biosynthesis [Luteimicrobium subarcticum]